MNLQEMLVEEYGPFMDIDELSKLLKVKRQSMYQQLYHGKLNITHAKLGKKYLFPTPAVAEYIDAKLVTL